MFRSDKYSYFVNKMNLKNYCNEESFLKNLFFNDFSINKDSLKKLNFEKLIQISSSHLILPALYVNLKKKKILRLFPIDFRNYLKNIYQINYNRNKEILNEAKELFSILKSESINFNFIKGVEYLMSEIYDNLGERMIGDIDILVEELKVFEVKVLLNKYDYFGDSNFKYMKNRHLPRLINTRKFAAVEIHTELLLMKKKYLFNADLYFNSLSLNYCDKISNLCILNFQINDYGHLFGRYSYKTYYDLLMIQKFCSVKIKYLDNKYIRRFFLISNQIGVTNEIINENYYDKLYMLRLKLKTNKFYNFWDKIVCKLIKYLPIRTKQIMEFLNSQYYRRKVFKAIKSKY